MASQQRIIRINDIVENYGISRATIHRLIADQGSGFPAKIQLSARSVGFYVEEIDAWLDSRKTSQSKGGAA